VFRKYYRLKSDSTGMPLSKDMAKKLQSIDGDTYSLMHINAFLY